MKYVLSGVSLLLLFICSMLLASEDFPRTNWGAVMKVPTDKITQVDQALIDWGNWIKATHPLGPEDKNNLESLSITRSEPFDNHVYYVIIERYPTAEGLANHGRIYQQTVNSSEYKDVFRKFRSIVGPYFISAATQRRTVYSLVPSLE
jgi:hypothetical protein